MDYELAKKLKDAGFPHHEGSEGYFVHADEHTAWSNNRDSALVYLPTLEELIEACGKNLESMYRLRDGWKVFSSMRRPEMPGLARFVIEARTLDKAVAELWIAHQNKGK